MIDFMIPWTAIMPELVLTVSALALLLLGVFNGDKSARSITVCTIVALALGMAAVLSIQFGVGDGQSLMTADNFHKVDAFASFIKLLVLAGAILSLLVAPGFLERQKIARPEYPVLVLLAVIGMMVMISANNFLMLYVGLELQSLALYVLAAFRRDASRSTEAGLKYFVLGALASGILLYGISLVYGYAGSIEFTRIAELVGAGTAGAGVKVGMVFILAALAFKVSAAPFHMWTPDVYEGAPTPVTTFFSVVPKVAALGLLVRVLFGPFGALEATWAPLITILAALSMVVGALGAIGQTNIKRLLAYSSIGHVGFSLMALATGSQQGVQAVLIYLSFYIVMSVGAFSVVLLMRRDDRMIEDISELAGVSRLHPGLAAGMAILMFSMAGIPPMVGFFTKLYVFMATLQAGLYGLAVLGAVASVVSAYYYIRIIKVMYFDEPVVGFDRPNEGSLAVTLVGTSLITLAGVGLLSPLAGMAALAVKSLAIP